MTLKLPENFMLPDGPAYDGMIEQLDQEIQAEGSASLYLAMMRTKRRDSRMMSRVLYNQTEAGMALEQRDEDGDLVDRTHKLANTALSGMVFGHFVNEKHYPFLQDVVYPYLPPIQIKLSFLGDHMAKYIELGAHSTVEGRRLGLGAMAETQLSQISDESAAKIHQWSREAIIDPKMRTNFTFGVGFSMYQAWVAYHHILEKLGRIEETSKGEELIRNNRGDTTSI